MPDRHTCTYVDLLLTVSKEKFKVNQENSTFYKEPWKWDEGQIITVRQTNTPYKHSINQI